ncbi:hypothetical protein ACYOEI_01285 [Singulisphaera rosea]
MGTTYIAPVQQMDPTCCWAASLEFWSRKMSPGRTVQTQLQLIKQYKSYWDVSSTSGQVPEQYGTITGGQLISIMNEARWRMDVTSFKGSQLKESLVSKMLKEGPFVLGYHDFTVGGGHANVILSIEAHLAPWADLTLGDLGGTYLVSSMDPGTGVFTSRYLEYYSLGNCYAGYPRPS